MANELQEMAQVMQMMQGSGLGEIMQLAALQRQFGEMGQVDDRIATDKRRVDLLERQQTSNEDRGQMADELAMRQFAEVLRSNKFGNTMADKNFALQMEDSDSRELDRLSRNKILESQLAVDMLRAQAIKQQMDMSGAWQNPGAAEVPQHIRDAYGKVDMPKTN